MKSSEFRRICMENDVINEADIEMVAAAYIMLPHDPDGAWASLNDFGIDIPFDDIVAIWKGMYEREEIV